MRARILAWVATAAVAAVLAASAPALATATGGDPAAAHPKVLFVPFQPIFRSAPGPKVQAANDLIGKELGRRDDLTILRVGAGSEEGGRGGDPGGTAPIDVPEDGEKLRATAEAAEGARDIDRAIALRRQLVGALEKAPGAPFAAYLEAVLKLGRALMWSGEDAAALEVIGQAAAMDPAAALDRRTYSRLYRRWFQKAAEQAVRAKPGELLVTSAIPGAEVTLDGRSMDVTPVLLKQVLPGRHLVVARSEGARPFGATVEVKSGQKGELAVVFPGGPGGSDVGAVADALARNAVPPAAVAAAARAGRRAGAAFVVIGALARAEDRFQVHPFVVEVGSARIAPLEVVHLDLELLTAESDVLRLADAVGRAVAAFPSSAPAQIDEIEKRVKQTTTINEVAAAPASAGERRERTPVKEPNGRAVYQPLKGGTVRIKDESD